MCNRLVSQSDFGDFLLFVEFEGISTISISIRKVMGASSANLVLLLSRGFLVLLSISALIAVPATYFFFERVVLTRFPYHTPVQVAELFAGLLAVLVIAFMMIGSQTMKAARSNPAELLNNES